MSTDYDFLENGPLGRRYIIHLESKDEICLRALSILQADLLPCYVRPELSPASDRLIFNLNGCIPLSEVKGKDAVYVKQHACKLITDFLSDMLRSLNYALDLSGISFVSENLFFHHTSKRLVCIFLPLSSLLQGKTGRLSDTDEHALDELLHVPYEKKWISPRAMEKLYSFFRSDDEISAASYIKNDLFEQSRPLPSFIRNMILVWSVFFLSYVFCSVYIERSFAGTPVALVPGALFFFCTISLLTALLLQFQENRKESAHLFGEKEKRRKSRNAQMLFPDQNDRDSEKHPLSLSVDPVLFTENQTQHSDLPKRFTVWTEKCTLGQDSDICDIVLKHSSIALYHAVFCHDEHGFYIEAVQNGKGTFKNRKRLLLNEKAYLEEGDIIGIGDLEFVTRFVHPKDGYSQKAPANQKSL